MRKTFLFTVACLAIIISLASAQPAEAVELAKPQITISPAITEWVLKPGQAQTKTIKVINPRDEPLPLRVVAKPMEVSEEVAVADDRERFDASRWFTVSDPYFILKAKEARDVKITLKLPRNATAGGHYATIYFEQFVPVAEQPETRVAAQVGALAFITADRQIVKWLQTSGTVNIAHKEKAVDIGITLKNTGNIHMMPTGKFIISDQRGRLVKTLPLHTGMVLPGTERQFIVTWRNPPTFGHFTVKTEISYGEKSTQLPVVTARFWIVPGMWITVFLVGLIGGLLIWWFGYRIRGRWVRAMKLLFKD